MERLFGLLALSSGQYIPQGSSLKKSYSDKIGEIVKMPLSGFDNV
jgi:hypothetical protein